MHGISKVSCPVAEGIVSRKRLFDLLSQATQSAALWIAAAPGAGKTSLAASYLQKLARPSLWYRCDSDDADPASFFHYLALAAQDLIPDRHLLRLTSEYRDLPHFCRRFFERFYANIPSGSIIVFDDCHATAGAATFPLILSTAIAVRPKTIEVILLSREGPPPEMARLRANRRLTLLPGRELVLREAECREIITRQSGDLPQPWVNRIIGLAGGWAAGLILLIESRNLDDCRLSKGEGSVPQEIFDYFANEVFSRMDHAVEALLMRVAFLREFTPEMATAISGREEAGSILARLHRDNCFLEKHRSAAEISYRLHPLCCSYFLRQARQRFDQGRFDSLYRRAAEILEASGRIEAAVGIWLERRNWDDLGAIISRHAKAFLRQGRNRTILTWLQALPEPVRAADPILLYWYGAAILPFDLQAARSAFTTAYRRLRRRRTGGWLLLAWAGVVETYLHGEDRLADLDRWINAMNSLWPRYSGEIQREVLDQVVVQMFGALTVRRLGRRCFLRWRQRAEGVVAEPSSDPSLRLLAGFYLYSATIWQGQWREAAVMVARMGTILNQDRATPLVRITECMTRTWAWLAADHATTLAAMNEGLAIAGKSGVHLWDYLLMIQGAASALSTGDLAGAGAILTRLEVVLEQGRKLDQSYYYYLISWRHSLLGEIDAALFHQKKALSLAQEVGLDFLIAQSRVAIAHLEHSLGQQNSALQNLDRALRTAQRLQAHSLHFVGLITKALFCFSDGDQNSGQTLLKQALRLGRRQGYINFSWWHCDWMARLCGHALNCGMEREYVLDLIRRRRLTPAEGQLGIEHWPWPIQIRTLGHFDLILRGTHKTFPVKPPKKPLALLKLCIALGGREVSQNTLVDTLWPEADGDAAAKSFSVTLTRLRRLLGEKDVLMLNDGRLSLNRHCCEVDIWTLEKLAAEIQRRRDDPAFLAHAGERLVSIYRGDFLADENEPWIYPTRERLRRLYRKLKAIK
jgi:LuxR family transcriptional regulator, maltose regulon positive regulatory protein